MPSQHPLVRCSCLALLLVLVLTAACTAPAAAPPAAAPTQAQGALAVAPTAAPPTAASALPTGTPGLPPQVPGMAGLTPATDACSSLEPALFKALGVQIATAEVPFTEPFSGKSGTACELSAQGTGKDFQSVDVVMGALLLIFDSHGWTADGQYDADGPTGMGRGFRQGDLLAIASVGWKPSPDANCPKDQPISACQLTPEQQLYTVSISCMRGAVAPAPSGIVPAIEAGRGLEAAVAEALGVAVTATEEPFTNPLNDIPGTSYRLSARGTGADFASLDEAMGVLQSLFEAQGWTAEDMYVADGPTGTARGFRLGDALAIAMVHWEPAPDAGCPPDKLISECNLKPEQILYTVTIDCVQGL